MPTDLLGREMTEDEAAVYAAYEGLKDLVRRGDLPPCALANLRSALAHTWNAVNDLGLDYEHLLDDGV